MKISRILPALLAAVIPFSAANTSSPLLQTVYADAKAGTVSLPEWIPTDFETALNFRNNYGTTHIEDGLLCIVFKEDRECDRKGETNGKPHYSISANGSAMAMLSDDTFGTDDYRYDYQVVVYEPLKTGDFNIALIDNWVHSSSLEPELNYVHYAEYVTFSVDENKNITETDSFGWLPDCASEYEDFVKENGEVSVKDNYVMFCLDSDVGTPYTWQLMLTGFGDHFEEYDYTDCSKETETQLDGGTSHVVRVFKAKQDGSAQIGFEYSQYLVSERPNEGIKSLVADCEIVNDAQTILLPNEIMVTLIDGDTGELIGNETLDEEPFYFIQSTKRVEIGDMIEVKTNPCKLDAKLDTVYDKENYLGYWNNQDAPEPDIKENENGSAVLTFKYRTNVEGDVNGDNIFSVSDAVLLEKWLLGSSKADIKHWERADYCKDGILDTYDLCLMKKALVQNIKLPTSVNIHKSGGIEGISQIWKTYEKGGKYYISYQNMRKETIPVSVPISKEDYLKIMSADYDKMIHDSNVAYPMVIYDDFYFKTDLTYEDGSELTTYAKTGRAITLMDDISCKAVHSPLYKIAVPVKVHLTQYNDNDETEGEWEFRTENSKPYLLKRIFDTERPHYLINEITEEELTNVLSIDYESYANDTDPNTNYNGLHFKTEVTYSNNSVKTIEKFIPEIFDVIDMYDRTPNDD